MNDKIGFGDRLWLMFNALITEPSRAKAINEAAIKEYSARLKSNISILKAKSEAEDRIFQYNKQCAINCLRVNDRC